MNDDPHLSATDVLVAILPIVALVAPFAISVFVEGIPVLDWLFSGWRVIALAVVLLWFANEFVARSDERENQRRRERKQ